MSVNVEDEAEGRRVFEALAEGGEVKMPFGPTFWAKGFGMLVDRYEIPWMVNAPDRGLSRDCPPATARAKAGRRRQRRSRPCQSQPGNHRSDATRIACDGGGGAGGHPRVWLQIDPEKGWVECGYCDRRYVLKPGRRRRTIDVTTSARAAICT